MSILCRYKANCEAKEKGLRNFGSILRKFVPKQMSAHGYYWLCDSIKADGALKSAFCLFILFPFILGWLWWPLGWESRVFHLLPRVKLLCCMFPCLRHAREKFFLERKIRELERRKLAADGNSCFAPHCFGWGLAWAAKTGKHKHLSSIVPSSQVYTCLFDPA